MALEQELVIAFRLFIATLLSMIVGLDRERRDKDAGLRTHMLVGIGACLFTALSLVAFPHSETARVAANVVTGVGFLGAGVIYKGENRVHDLTTAANIWITAAIGMAVGVSDHCNHSRVVCPTCPLACTQSVVGIVSERIEM